ncbi:MAG: glycosyltransferase family 2 protein [Patescibacteria group bacterium]
MLPHYLHIGSAQDLSHNRRAYWTYRALEILPGFLAWGTLLATVVLPFFAPTPIALFIIAFDVYWLLKAMYLSMHMRATFSTMRGYVRRDWNADMQNVTAYAPELNNARWDDLYHLIILPMYTEPHALVRESFLGLIRSTYPHEKMIVVLATEERAGAAAQETATKIVEEFGGMFRKLMVTTHPYSIAGEIPGKGSNDAWAARKVVAEYIDPESIPHERVIVSVFDIDSVVHPSFFAMLTWQYLTAEKPTRSSFQPIPLFTNNIWEAPAFARVFAFATTFWQMIQQARPEHLVTFSSHSMSLAPLVDIGYWQTNVVSEDSRVFWQCLLRFDGDWRTIPLAFPIAMDANVAPTFWQTLVNQYKQIRRWMFGVENNPYFMYGFLHNKRIPLRTKLRALFFMIESSHSAATHSLVIFLLGWLPVIVGGSAFATTVLSYNLPQVTRFIMTLAAVGLVANVAISIALLPPRPPQYGKRAFLWMALQWLLLPINLMAFGALPALESQTRLMFGKYLGFWVTPKERHTTAGE